VESEEKFNKVVRAGAINSNYHAVGQDCAQHLEAVERNWFVAFGKWWDLREHRMVGSGQGIKRLIKQSRDVQQELSMPIKPVQQYGELLYLNFAFTQLSTDRFTYEPKKKHTRVLGSSTQLYKCHCSQFCLRGESITQNFFDLLLNSYYTTAKSVLLDDNEQRVQVNDFIVVKSTQSVRIHVLIPVYAELTSNLLAILHWTYSSDP
jgi:hypothetical protein